MKLENGISIVFEKLIRWEKALISMLPNFILSALIITAFFFIAKLLRNVAYKIVFRISRSESLSGLFAAVLQSIVLIIGLMMALNILQLEKTVSSLLAGVGIIGLALGFAFQDLTANFISGVFMSLRRPFEVGDKVDTNGFVGIVYHIQLRATTLVTTGGLHVTIPNKDIFQKPIINYSRSNERRVEIEFTILNTFDLTVAASLIQKAIEGIGTSNPISDIEVYYSSTDEAKVKVTVSFQIDNAEPKGFLNARHQAIVAVYKAFGEKGILKIAPLSL